MNYCPATMARCIVLLHEQLFEGADAMRLRVIFTAATLLASCGNPLDVADPQPSATASPSPTSSTAPEPDSGTTERWSLQPSGEGVVLALRRADRSAVIRLFCPTGEDTLLVNVPGFEPIDSEERLSFGSAGAAAALVADPGGAAQHGGVTGTGKVPADLAALIGGRISASYGAQSIGPHPAPASSVSSAFVTACGKKPVASPHPKPRPKGAVSACSVQNGKSIRVPPRRAVGTEPFWAARIDGRCVIYSHPEDPNGVRVWTRYAKTPTGETWSGTLDGQLFELRVRLESHA